MGCIAEKIREGLKGFIGTTVIAPKMLKVGDVAVTTEFVQFHTDMCTPSNDPNIIRLNMTFLGAGALMVVLKFGEHNGFDRAYTLDLHTGKTGWIDKEALAPYE